MTSKIFRSTVFVAVVVLLCSLGIVIGVLYNYFTGVQVEQLKDELSPAVTGTEQYGYAFLENVEADRFRVTWIDVDGTVLFDTQVDESTMENHADREEIREAFATGSGSAVRNSSTLTEQTYYEARRLTDGTVLRISANQASAWALMMDLLWPIILIAVLAIGLSALLARRMAKNIVEPLNKLNLEQPLSNDTYEELSPLLRRINQQHLQIDAQMRKLQRKTDEFIQITSNMQEGLVVLDKETRIRSINSAAMQIFGAEESCVGSSFFQVNRSNALRQALNDALDRGHGSAVLELEGRIYRFDMSSIQSDGNLLGAVILVVDVTETQNAEQMRREFSANVSHELKTPLQGIIGSAELLESGMVKPEDTPRFVGHIRKEAARLVNLIEDIIRLSQLGEGVELPAEQVDILALAEDVKEILGQNIGTCITAIMGAIGANRNARRTAMVHLLFNVVGAVMFAVIFYGMGMFIEWKFLSDIVQAWDISVIHTGFNLIATAVLMPMNGLLVKLAYLLVPEVKEPEKTELLDARLLATPAVAVQRAHEIAGEMAADAAKAMHLAMGLTKKFESGVMEQVIELEDKTDRYEDALNTYLVKLSGMNLSVNDNRILNTLLYTVSDIERMADHAMAVAKAALEIEEKKIEFSKQAKGELAVLEQAVLDIVDRTVAAYGNFDLEQAVRIEPQEQVVDALVREVKSRHVRRLRDGLCTVEYGFVLEDLLTACERTADHCSNVAVEMLQVAEGKLEAHEYLNALKAGELRESAAFAEQFARYKAQYAFPEEQ